MTPTLSAVADGDLTLAASAVRQQSQAILAHATIRTASHGEMVRSAQNARKKPRDLRELTALLRAQGLLQNLVCHQPQVDGVASGPLVVDAGDGRWQAIGSLIADGSWPADFQIPYLLVTEAEAVLVSLAENLGRAPLHAADLCAGMLALADAGHGVADIALCFGLSELTVRQRLKLANVAPALLALYRDDQIAYEQLAALAVSDDPAAQQAAWDSLQPWERQPARLRRLLTAHCVALRSDPVARYVGLAAYQAAGGRITRDLFSDVDGGYIEDGALLDRLAAAKLERLAQRLRRERWPWVSVQPRTTPAILAAYGRVRSTSLTPTPQQQADLQRLAQRAAALDEQADANGDADGAIARELTAIDIARARITAASSRPDAADMALAGMLLTVDAHGKACVLRGLIRPHDLARVAAAPAHAKAPKLRGPHSGKLLTLLAAQRSAALRAELVRQPDVALLVLAHQLLSAVFYAAARTCSVVQLSLRAPALPTEVEDGSAWQSWQAQRAALAAQLPPGAADLMAWLQCQPRATVDRCIAFCLSCSIDGMQEGMRAEPALAALSQAVGLDMHRYWQPTAHGYFQHVSKRRMMDVVAQVVSPQAAVPLEAMTRERAAQEAARAVADSGWLPEPLATAPEVQA